MTSRLSLKRENRIKKSDDFNSVYRTGYRITGSFYSVSFLKSAGECSRLGITVSRKVGNAVVRNYLKRVVREKFRKTQAQFRSPLDVVVSVRFFPADHPKRLRLELARLFECLKSFEVSSGN